MNETFEASNGIDVSISEEGDGTFLLGKGGVIEGGVRRWTVATGNAEGIVALREFFQHERDKELGRWRDPESPERFVVPGHADDWIQVWNEARMKGEGTYTRSSAVIHFGNPKYPCAATAKRYFAAHPEPKPWHDAKPGEVWELRILNGPPQAYGVTGGGEFRHAQHGDEPRAAITAGRRIWPEVSGA